MSPPPLHYLSVSELPSVSANSIQVMRMCEAFAGCGRPVRLHAFKPKNAARVTPAELASHYGVEPGFEIRRYPRVKPRHLLMGLNAAARPGRVIYARNMLASAHAVRLGRPVALEIHHPYAATRREHGLLQRLSTHPQCLGLVAISHALKDRLLQDYPGFRDRILVAPDAASPVPRDVGGAMAPERGIGRFNVGYVGSLYAGKGVMRIVAVARELAWATFHIVGDTEQLRKRGVDPGDLPSNVVLHGHQPPRAVGELIAEFDVLLAPYRREVKPHAALDIAPWMSPLKIFEYMAAGKPIVAADLPVIREVLTDGETALLCSPDDDGDWVAALRRLHEEPELGRRIGAQAHDEWRRAYTWQARASTILDWIDVRSAALPAHPAGRLSGLAR